MDHQDYLEGEITCLEKTLVQRRAELRVADRLLQECQADLKDATDKVCAYILTSIKFLLSNICLCLAILCTYRLYDRAAKNKK